ncbi:hypothetical protein JOD18_004834 [Gracilibacillus alcaliphilus]|nr:hypothetical protein [Gracilibacillus alcaliphilus]
MSDLLALNNGLTSGNDGVDFSTLINQLEKGDF